LKQSTPVKSIIDQKGEIFAFEHKMDNINVSQGKRFMPIFLKFSVQKKGLFGRESRDKVGGYIRLYLFSLDLSIVDVKKKIFTLMRPVIKGPSLCRFNSKESL
jgi:hypothetical protein